MASTFCANPRGSLETGAKPGDLDLELVRRFNAGQTVAFDALYERNSTYVYNTCLGMLGNPDDARDALQDTPVKDAIEQLVKVKAGGGYAVEIDIQGRVAVDMVDVPWEDAFHTVLRTANLTTRMENCLCIIGPKREPSGERRVQPSTQKSDGAGVHIVPSQRAGGPPTFEIILDNADATSAIRELMELTRQNYVFDTLLGYGGPRMTAALRNMTFGQAIELISRATGLVITEVNGAYYIALPGRVKGGALPGYDGGSRTSLRDLPMQFRCPKCNGGLAPEWRFCPTCGMQVQPAEPRVLVRPDKK